MSRIGFKPIKVPGTVTVTSEKGHIAVKGPKGELAVRVAESLTLSQEDGVLKIDRPDNDRFHRSQHGLARTLIDNMVTGVTEGHKKTLEIHGVGYRASMEGKTLVLSVGYSHTVKITPPEGIDFNIAPDEKTRVTTITVSGIDKAVVGQIAADIRKARKPDPYKGKGVRYKGEVVKLRPGKRAGK
ncbi:MAG: 50S ribosomal protein L6 [Fimbriimonadaceae bacterium]|nr:50S ribosomal protein L6 [Fimbriimonadaceae bacterium]QYK55905.1 MAG: 50S ribosomal protein L6 [Fimbriimonadaceae bacterium]